MTTGRETARAAIETFIGREIGRPLFHRAAIAAADIRQALGDSALAVIFYGSCLRQANDHDKILDFYVIVDDYRHAYGGGWRAVANRLLPPNVFYRESADEGLPVRSKCAVLSMADFIRLTGPGTFNSTLWARLAQPVALSWCRDRETRAALISGLVAALTTLVRSTVPLMPETFTSARYWSRAFNETYRVELRAEGVEKGSELYHMDAARYDALLPLALTVCGFGAVTVSGEEATYSLRGKGRIGGTWWACWAWFLRRVQGKVLSILRLVKGAFTFRGGADYLAWKISRHSGVAITLTPWQKRHPVLAGITLIWRLRRSGAIH